MSFPTPEELTQLTGSDVLVVIRRLLTNILDEVEREIETVALHEAAQGHEQKRDGLYRAVGIVAKHRKAL